MKENFPRTNTQRHNLRMEFIGAAEQGNVGHARAVLDRAQDGDIDANTLDQALIVSARAGRPFFVRWLIEETPLDLKRAGPETLAQALKERDRAVAEALTAPGIIDLSPGGEDVPDALCLAIDGAEPVDAALLQLLLDGGARPSGMRHDALDSAIRKRDKAALDLLLHHAPRPAQAVLDERLVRAAAGLDLSALRFLLKSGAHAAAQNDAPARQVLARLKSKEHGQGAHGRDAACCLHALLEAGADAAGDIAQDALVAASLARNTTLTHYLLKKGVDPEPRWRGTGYNRLVIAARHGFSRLIEQMHAAEKFEDHYYHEAMRTAAERGNLSLIDQFTGYGFDPKTLPELDLPFAAAVGGQPALVRQLAQRGLKTDLTHHQLIEAVVEGDHAEMMDYMLDHGADLHLVRDKYFRRAGTHEIRPAPALQAVIEKWEKREETLGYQTAFGPGLDALRTPCRDRKGRLVNGFFILAKADRFDEALARQNPAAGAVMTPLDLSVKDSKGNRVIDVLGAKGQIKKLFDPKLWEGRSAEMMRLLDAVPPVYRRQVDADKMTAQFRHEALQKRAQKKPSLRL